MTEDNSGKAELKVEKIDSVMVITPLMSEISFKNAKGFLQQVKDVADRESRNIVLDLEKVEIIDSVSLGTLVAIKKYAKRHNCDVSVANLSYMILELFRLLNFPAVFDIYDTVDQALAAYRDKE